MIVKSVQYHLCEKTLNKKEEETQRTTERCAVFLFVFYYLVFIFSLLLVSFILLKLCSSFFSFLYIRLLSWLLIYLLAPGKVNFLLEAPVFHYFLVSLFPCVSLYRWVRFPRSVSFSSLCSPKSAKEYILQAKHRTSSSTARAGSQNCAQWKRRKSETENQRKHYAILRMQDKQLK